jgi:hypothetical protein
VINDDGENNRADHHKRNLPFRRKRLLISLAEKNDEKSISIAVLYKFQ